MKEEKKLLVMGDRGIVREIFIRKGRLCVIIEMVWECNPARTFMEGAMSSRNYHNGYVQTLNKNKNKGYDRFIDKIKTDELTFSGELIGFSKDISFFGFDSAHVWNDHVPKSKTFEEVKKRTIKMCDEMVRKGI